MTGAERLRALRALIQQMPDCEIIARLGDITQRGRVEAVFTALLASAQECRAYEAAAVEPGIEAMLSVTANRWERVLW